MKKRLDQHLVDQGLAPSKTKAQEMIELGQVTLKHRKSEEVELAKKAAQIIDSAHYEIHIAPDNLLKFVSRSGFKLEAALRHIQLDVHGMSSLDLGQSTGGFTDCLLQYGAAHVTGVDVARSELAERLVNDSRVTAFVETNARELSENPDFKNKIFDIVVIDVSFISLKIVLPEGLNFLKSGGHLLALVKPQFEVGSANIGKGGIVKNASVIKDLEKNMLQFAATAGLIETQYFAAQIKGRDGNQEFFIYGKKK